MELKATQPLLKAWLDTRNSKLERNVWCRACATKVAIIRFGITKIQACPRVHPTDPVQFEDNAKAYGCDLELGGEEP